MKILFLSHYFYPGVGGIETVSDILTHAFHEAGHEVRVMTWTKEEGKRTFPFSIIREPSLTRMIKEHRWADLVFENNPSMRLGWPRLLFRRKTIIVLHTWIDPKGKTDFTYRLKKRYIGTAGKVIAPSHAVCKRCWPDALVIENPYRDSLFRRLPDIQKIKDFVFLGRLVSDKGPLLAMQAFQKLVEEQRTVSLTIIGKGEERTKLEAFVAKAGIADMVTFTGSITGEALVDCLNEHRFLLVPSVWDEPFGLVALEGMACGCVPIVSDSGGLPDAAGSAGVTFAKGNADELSQRMKELFFNAEKENELRLKAPDHLQKHTIAFISQRYLEEVNNLFKKTSPSK